MQETAKNNKHTHTHTQKKNKKNRQETVQRPRCLGKTDSKMMDCTHGTLARLMVVRKTKSAAAK